MLHSLQFFAVKRKLVFQNPPLVLFSVVHVLQASAKNVSLWPRLTYCNIQYKEIGAAIEKTLFCFVLAWLVCLLTERWFWANGMRNWLFFLVLQTDATIRTQKNPRNLLLVREVMMALAFYITVGSGLTVGSHWGVGETCRRTRFQNSFILYAIWKNWNVPPQCSHI